MNLEAFNELLELRHRRALSPGELRRVEDWLAAHPEDRSRWLAEERLATLLARLPDQPVASNFTARVWQAIEREERTATRRPAPARHRWLPRLAWLGVGVVALALLTVREEARRRQLAVADSLVQVGQIASVPTVEMLRDFAAINSLGQPMLSGDWELLAAFEAEAAR